jgi:tetratricopeptide (TPR) repeat protein
MLRHRTGPARARLDAGDETLSPGAIPRGRGAWPMAAAGLLLLLAIVAYQRWPELEKLVDFTASAPAGSRTLPNPAPQARPQSHAQAQPQPQPQPRDEAPALAGDWMPAFQRAMQASIAKRPQDAIRDYGEALGLVERQRGANHPLGAAMLERIAEVHIQSRQYAEAETALRRSLAMLEGHSHAAVRADAGRLVLGFDRESVLRKLGWSLWELRRYADSLDVYQRAYETAKELDIAEPELNRRLAYSSAGIMAAACTQREWQRANRAMAELKDRMQRVSPDDRRWLEYWVRTGEPRLAAKQC